MPRSSPIHSVSPATNSIKKQKRILIFYRSPLALPLNTVTGQRMLLLNSPKDETISSVQSLGSVSCHMKGILRGYLSFLSQALAHIIVISYGFVS